MSEGSTNSAGTELKVHRLEGPDDQLEASLEEMRRGLRGSPKALQPKLLYDGRGSELFEAITHEPEYYPTRAEAEILERHAPALMSHYAPEELLEVGSGSSRKTQLLISSMLDAGGVRYVPFDVSEDAVRAAAEVLGELFPTLEISGVIGDFHTDLHSVPHPGRRVVAFLGSTIGNLVRDERAALLQQLRSLLREGDALLLGFDLAKDRETLEAAYNDAAGITRDFIQNVLVVLNRDYGANFRTDRFRYRGTWDAEASRMDIGLVSRDACDVRIDGLDMDLHFEAGEYMRVEVSTKFRPLDLSEELRAAGLEPARYLFDAARRFSLAVVELGPNSEDLS